MGLLDDAKSSVSKWFEEQVAKNKAFKAAGGMGKSNPAMTRSMGLLPATGLLEQEGDAAARADAAYGALRKEYGPLGLRPGDFVPFASGGLAIDDARLAAAKGNYGQAAGSLAGVIPVAGAVGKVVRKITGGKSSGVIDSVKREIFAGPNAKTANKAAINRFETEADRRMAAAQRNAALPFEQGGLGLPADNTPMDRARAMGFDVDTNLLHGTSSDFGEFSDGRIKTYLTNKPEIAEIYANARARDSSVRNKNAEPNIIPVITRNNNELIVTDVRDGNHGWSSDNLRNALGTDQKRGLYDIAQKQGIDRVRIDDMLDLGGEQSQWVVADPSNIRSRFAAFDPMRRNESDLLALNGQKTGSGLLNPEITKATNRGLYRTMLDDEEDKPSFPYGLIGK